MGSIKSIKCLTVLGSQSVLYQYYAFIMVHPARQRLTQRAADIESKLRKQGGSSVKAVNIPPKELEEKWHYIRGIQLFSA